MTCNKTYILRCTNEETAEHTRKVGCDGRLSYDVSDSEHTPKSKAEQLRGMSCPECSGRLLGVSQVTE